MPEPGAARFVARGLVILLAPLLAGCGSGGAGEGGAGADTALLRRIGGAPEHGTAHPVRLVAQGDRYAFDPAEVHVRAGDEVRFVLAGAQPESVAFDTLHAAPEARAWVRERGLVRGALLTVPGEVYTVSFRGAPPGHYPYFSVPHAAAGMRGVVVVAGDRPEPNRPHSP